MSQKHPLLKGTFILTTAGILTRIMGFFYRIFLSRNFSAEEVGLYQLIFPVYTLAFSITSAGIETALARQVAANVSRKQDLKNAVLLKSALFFSVTLSAFVLFILQKYSSSVASHFLGDSRCSSLLMFAGYALPFAAIHSCVCGYFLGNGNARIPAGSQLFEQSARIFSVFLFFLLGIHRTIFPPVTIAVFGLICGEIAASFLSVHALHSALRAPTSSREFLSSLLELLRDSVPLTASRVLLNLFQSTEAVSIPLALQKYGMSQAGALSTYGILTGMALPCILFPSALTNSISTMLLPTVAGMSGSKEKEKLSSLLGKILFFCLFLGFACLLFFFIAGNFIGRRIFDTPEAGNYILTLAFICPFIYTNTALTSTLNGLSLSVKTFFINLLSLSIRIASIVLFIPQFGIIGYLRGLLVSQLFTFIISLFLLIRYLYSSH